MTIKITDEMVEAVGQEVYGDNWEPRHDHIGTWQPRRPRLLPRTPHDPPLRLRVPPGGPVRTYRDEANSRLNESLDPDFGRNPVNGQDSPDAALHAAYDEGLQTALALLEGGDNQ